MKSATYYRPARTTREVIPYPNAATRRQIMEKAIDLLLLAASGAGTAAAILFLLTLG